MVEVEKAMVVEDMDLVVLEEHIVEQKFLEED